MNLIELNLLNVLLALVALALAVIAVQLADLLRLFTKIARNQTCVFDMQMETRDGVDNLTHAIIEAASADIGKINGR